MIGLTDSQNYSDIAGAIRNKLGTATTYTPSQMANAILQISGGESSGFVGTPTAGDTPIAMNMDLVIIDVGTSVKASGMQLVTTRAGTYRIKYAIRNSYSSSSSFSNKAACCLYKNGTAAESEHSLDGSFIGTFSVDVQCEAGDVLEVYASSANSTYKVLVSCMAACIDWNNGF